MVSDGDYTYHGGCSIMYIIYESLSCSSETDIILYINYISIKCFKKGNEYILQLSNYLNYL